jgi:hypothetical protein
VPLQRGDERKRQIGERPHVEIDHRELFLEIDLGRRAGQAEAGVVDHDVGLDVVHGQQIADAIDRVGLPKIDRHHQWALVAERRDRVGKLGEAILPARDQDELMAMLGEDASERGADAGRSAGDQRDRAH